MNYEDIREQFESLTSAERLQKLNLMWPELPQEIQLCVMMLIVAILGPEEIEAISHVITAYVALSDEESPESTPEPDKE